MNKRIVFFDFDGVIVDSFNLAFHIMKLREAGLSASEYKERFNENIYKHFDPGGLPETSTTSKSFRSFFGIYTPKILHMEYIRGIDDAITKLAADYTLIINSSTPSQTIRAYLTLHGLENNFSDIFGAEAGFNKSEKFREALAQYGAKPEDTIFITDTLGDIREATIAHIATVAVTWGYHDESRLAKGEPAGIARAPQELPGLVHKYFQDAKDFTHS